ncbi:hypothetical protein [Streptomyces sp. NPDC059788]|uniref:hypothetical protein n=1 Tax=Streptomyces sp. NPDC059788 TaxID=3346948 RepID=UPI003669E313
MVHPPLVLVLLITVVFLTRKAGLKTGHALVTILFGFFLHDSHLAGPLQNAVASLAHAISQLRL